MKHNEAARLRWAAVRVVQLRPAEPKWAVPVAVSWSKVQMAKLTHTVAEPLEGQMEPIEQSLAEAGLEFALPMVNQLLPGADFALQPMDKILLFEVEQAE
jgi:hypothetical protein